jgi:MFS family permease
MKSNVLDSLKRMSAKEKRFLVATFCMYGSAYYLLNPTIPIFVGLIGADEQTGIVTGAFFGGVVLALPVASYLIDRFGDWVISWVTSCLTVMTITSYNLVINFQSVMTVQLLRGLLFGISISAADSMLTRLVSKDERAKAFGRMYSTSTVSLMLLSKPGIDLAEKDHFPLLWAVGAVLAILAAGWYLSIRVPKEKKREPRTGFVHTGVIPYGIAVMGVTCFCGVVFQYIQKYSLEEGFTGQGGYFLTVMAVSVLVFRHTVLGRLPSLTHQVVTTSMVLLMVSGFLLWFGTGVVPFYLAAVLVGVGYGVCIPSIPPLAYANVPQGRLGAMTATYNTLSYGGPLLGLVAGGYLGENIGYSNMYLVITPIILVSLVVWGAMKRRVAVDSA